MNAALRSYSFFAKAMTLVGVVLLAVLKAHARDATGSVSYSPTGLNFEGNMPFTQSATINVIAPSNLTGPATVSLVLTATQVPIGDTATALSYIGLSTSTLTFSAASQSLPVTITFTLPNLNLPPGTLPVNFAYKIETAGWPMTVSDFGFTINARATTPPDQGSTNQPPTVSISTPANNSIFAYNYGDVLGPIPLTFTALGNTDGPILSLDATLTSDATGLGIPLIVTPSGLLSPTATGNASMPIAVAGDYTISVRGVNQFGSATATHHFTVTVAGPPPPEVIIGTPADASTFTVASTSMPTTIPMTFTANATGTTDRAPITSVRGLLDGAPITLTNVVGLNSFTVTGGANLMISTAGSHTVTVYAVNAGGEALDSNTFTINVTAPPPTVVINTPTPNSVYNYAANGPAVIVPYTFTARSNFGGIRTLVAKVDGVEVAYTPTGLGALQEVRTINLPYTTAGDHTLEVTTSDDYGSATAVSNFTVRVVVPTPTIVITTPANGSVFNLPFGASQMSIPFAFTTTSNNGFVVDSVSASIDGGAAFNPTTVGLGTALATSTGTLPNLTSGTHTLTATGVSAGITVTTSTTFRIQGLALPPTVVINTPPVGSTYTRVTTGPALSIPMTFTGASVTPGAVITSLSASLDGIPLSVTPSNLNTAIATGSATMTVSAAGTHLISVSATDAYGTASATRTFVVSVIQGRTVSGGAFFDVNANGTQEGSEFDLSGVTVRLLNSSNTVVASATTSSTGAYAFASIAPGTYSVTATAPTGLRSTNGTSRSITVSATADVSVAKFGFALNFDALRGMTACGYTIGFWKNNLDKALANKPTGTQLTKTTLERYTSSIAAFALDPFDRMTMKTASSTMGSSSCLPKDLLAKQLVAAEYNYQNGAYLNGNASLTYLYIWWGEYVLKNNASYSSTYLIAVKDWFDAYNNTHGGAMLAPAAP